MSLRAHLGKLEASGLIHLAQAEPELEYLFRHALVQDAAYASLLKADRRVLHRAVGEALERLYPDQLASRELAPVLAHHFREAGDSERAFKYYALAGEAALRIYANQEAEAHYRAALSLAAAEVDKARALSGLGEALFRESRFEEAIRVWLEASRICRALNDADQAAWAYAHAVRAAGPLAETSRGLALCREGLAVFAGGPETPGMAGLLHEAARACHFCGIAEDAERFCRQALDMAERVGAVEVQAEALTTLGMLLLRTEEAALVFTKAIALAEVAGLLFTAARAYNNLGVHLAEEVGDLPQARNNYERGLELRRRRGDVAGEALAVSNLIQILLPMGELAAVENLLPAYRELHRQLREQGQSRFDLWSHKIEAQRVRYRGEWEQALQRLRDCRTLTQQQHALEVLWQMDDLLAEVFIEIDLWQAGASLWEEAESVLQEALELHQRNLGNPVRSLCLLSAVRAVQQRFAEAQRLIQDAQEQVRRTPLLAQEYCVQAEARLARAERRWPEAFAAFEATASAEARMGKRWYRAQTLHEWAEAQLSRNEPGDRERAAELLREALALFEEMNVPKYAERVRERLHNLTTS